jgi:hypothetical protein
MPLQKQWKLLVGLGYSAVTALCELVVDAWGKLIPQ